MQNGMNNSKVAGQTKSLNTLSNNAPIDSYNSKGVKVAVWEHAGDGSTFRQISLKKSYKDDSGNYKDTESFLINDIPQLVVMLQDVYRKEVLGEYRKA